MNLRERTRLSRALNGIDISIHSALGSDEIMQAALDGFAATKCEPCAIADYFAPSMANFFVGFPRTHNLRAALAVPLLIKDEVSGCLFAWMRNALLSRRTMLLDYEREGLPEADREIARANSSRLVLFVPLVHQDELIGHLALDAPDQRYDFSEGRSGSSRASAAADVGGGFCDGDPQSRGGAEPPEPARLSRPASAARCSADRGSKRVRAGTLEHHS